MLRSTITLGDTLLVAGTERLSSQVLQSNFHVMPGESLLPGNSKSMARSTWHDELCLHSSVDLMAADDAPSHCCCCSSGGQVEETEDCAQKALCFSKKQKNSEINK